jgi:hypothetical protein
MGDSEVSYIVASDKDTWFEIVASPDRQLITDIL